MNTMTPEQVEKLASKIPDESGTTISKLGIWDTNNDVILPKAFFTTSHIETEQPPKDT